MNDISHWPPATVQRANYFNEHVTFDVQAYMYSIRRRRNKFSLAAAKSSLTAAYNIITHSYDAGLQENNDYNTLNKCQQQKR